MGDVIDFYKWKSERRARLGRDPVRTYQRRARRDRREGSKPTATGLMSADWRTLDGVREAQTPIKKPRARSVERGTHTPWADRLE